MGIYKVVCPQCQHLHDWFSGNPDQRCKDCKEKTTLHYSLEYLKGCIACEIANFITGEQAAILRHRINHAIDHIKQDHCKDET